MKRHILGIDHEKLAAEIASLASFGNNELKVRWQAAYGTAAPVRMKRDLLRYAVAYRMQERALGGLKPATCRLLDRMADDAAARRPVKAPPPAQGGGGSGAGSPMGRRRARGYGAGEGGAVSRKTASLSLRSRACDHWAAAGRDRSSSASRRRRRSPMEHVKPQSGAARSTPGSPRKRVSSRTSTRCMRNARRARRLFRSQAGEGWRLIKTAYDDGGFSGGTMERPALQRLLDEYSRWPDRYGGGVQSRPADPRRLPTSRRWSSCSMP